MARPIIAEVIGCFSPGDDPRYVKKAVMATYPWGERDYWPYKVWCSEARRQLAAFAGKSQPTAEPCALDPSQPDLFAPAPEEEGRHGPSGT